MPARLRQNYGSVHQRTRKAWAPQVATGTVRCWRCNQLIELGEAWDLGHVPGKPSHPEHRGENRSEGAAYGNRKREPRTDIW